MMEAYSLTALDSFKRGLGEKIFLKMGDTANLTNLDMAIARATVAEVEMRSWSDVRGMYTCHLRIGVPFY